MSKPYRNRLSLFLRFSSTKSHVYSKGISSDSYPHPTSPTGSLPRMSSSLASPDSVSTSPSHSPKDSSQSIKTNNLALVRGEPIPPTTNDLDAEEKARLLKQARKLSRVFGEVPSLPPPPVPHRGISRHRRSSSLATSDTSHSSRSPRGSPSYQNLPHIDEALYDEDNSAQARQFLLQQQQRNGSRTREHSVHSVSSSRSRNRPTTPSSPSSTQSSRRDKMAKLRRHLGEDNIPVELISDVRPVKSRKSLDTLSLEKSKKHSSQGKNLRKTRSFVVEKPTTMTVPVQDAVEFHRRYVQNFGSEANAAAIKKRETSQSGEVHVTPTGSMQEPQAPNFYEEVDSSSSSHSEVHQSFSEPALPTSSFLSLTPRHSEGDLRSYTKRQPSSNSVDTIDSGLESVSNNTFRERRRRAAKLTQFFGVGYQDISASLPRTTRDIPQRSSPGPGPGVRVDIKTSGRRFWGDGHGTVRDADIADVIDKLRDLKAS
ncbi:hypothetical protein K435DRAFT_968020 [Dendrothele bispora CBS 962.96]|uniref:Uncharacterized protein n=1 Tax=Dendrothele bispora (strain CBS 962.96) TaxID=1314807 RepID=A0A4S8LRZ4_DENBC|nr:hypothetical protein K435DRAFT_968020 [Dendrothele bispora CBS 962.96]